MCTICFEKEYKSFDSEKEWLDFDLQLVKKLGSGKMEHITQEDGEYHYKCLGCMEKWKLSDPDHGFRGYFLKMKED